MPPRKRFLTTPIYYATDEPHVGHAYCTIATDAAARYRRLVGDEVRFLTGTDEHGQKMERQALKLGVSPRDLADRTAPRYRELWRALAISHDDFIRTTEARHRRAVEELWRRMRTSGDIYRGEYEGRYCVGCENFLLDRELVDGRCPDHGTVPEPLKVEGWFFRLSAFGERLLAHYEANPGFVQPESRRNEVIRFVRSGLRDLSISRASTRWGIPVPDDPEQVIYVWVDALTNYIAALGWPDAPDFAVWWPAEVHYVGKDILRFHAVYWPAFLMSAGVALPRTVFGHGWWLRGDRKIAKSSGPVAVQPYLETVGADALRYFLLREIPFGLDGNWSDDAFIARYNADLANDFGNLVSRALQMVGRYRGGTIPGRPELLPAAVRAAEERAIAGWRESFEASAFSKAIEAVFELVRLGNRWVDENAPWNLARDPARSGELDRVLYTGAELVRLSATLLHPVLPGKCGEVRGWLGLAPEPAAAEVAPALLAGGGRLGRVEPLFPRQDEKKWLLALAQRGERGEPGAAGTTGAPAPPPPADAAGAGLITIDEFFRAELKVALVVAAERVEKSKKLLRLRVDLGGEERQIVAGIAEKYAPERLVGKKVIVVANLKPARLMGLESQGMLLAASVGGLPVVATFEEDVPPGSRVK